MTCVVHANTAGNWLAGQWSGGDEEEVRWGGTPMKRTEKVILKESSHFEQLGLTFNYQPFEMLNLLHCI